MNNIQDRLSKYLPGNTLDLVCSYLPQNNLEISIVHDRITKLGDFRPASKFCNYHKISINKGLNPYSFLITLLHEIAHLQVFEKYGPKVKSHGKEWQSEYTELIFPFLEQHLLPDELHGVLCKHFPFPSASSSTDSNLVNVLRKYDARSIVLTLDNILTNDLFVFRGTTYKKIKKLRSYCYCIRVSDNRAFRIHSIAEVQHVTR